MKKILKIARLELSILFYSPIAWLVLIIFIVQSGVTFTSLLNELEAKQQLGNALESITANIFVGTDGFFTAVQKKLYLYIPLLTMGLMSREISSGSIKLLLSSPLTSAQIIFGKFFAMMAYGALLMLVLTGIMVSGAFAVENLDIPHVLGGMLGLYLLICAYSAIGVFMSSLTSYQIVAAISTLAVLAALNFAGSIGQSYDFVRDITYWISISGRTDNFVSGMIGSDDVVYFLMVIGLFLVLSIMKLDAGRQIRSLAVTILRYTAVVVTVLLIGYLTSMPFFIGYYDTTRFKTNTLTDNSLKIISQLKKPVSITTYPNVANRGFSRIGAPKMRKFELKQFEKYRRYLPGLKFNYVPYYDTSAYKLNSKKTLEEQARSAATAEGYDFDQILAPAEIKKVINLVPEENSFVRTVNYDGRHTFLRMYYDMIYYPQEAEISAALKRLLVKPPVVGILVQNDERSIDKTGDRAYKVFTNTMTVRGSLINQGFDMKRVELSAAGPIPTDLAVLIIADPKTEYTAAQLQKIVTYLNNGGNLLISGDPGRQAALNKIIGLTGAGFIQGTLMQEGKNQDVDLITAKLTPESKALNFNLSKTAIVTMPGAIGIQYHQVQGFNYIPLLVTNKQTVWNKQGTFDTGSAKIFFNPQTEQKVSMPVALAVTRKVKSKEQKIIIMGDADFMSNAEFSRSQPQNENWGFAITLFKWFSNGAFPIDTTRPKPTDNHILISRSGISWLKIIFLGMLPGILALTGASTLIMRKRK